jgi:cell division protein ZipA
MWELRWVLAGLGAALIVALYLWGRGLLRPKKEPGRRWLAADDQAYDDVALSSQEPRAGDNAELEAEETAATTPMAPERIVTIRFVARNRDLSTEKAVVALRAAGLTHGRFGIFHKIGGGGADDMAFSVASLVEPGSFDLAQLADTTIPGMSFFMILPGRGDPVERFDSMVETARTLAHDLDAELHDDRGSSWSIQRERYLREEMIEYRHQLGHGD